MQAELQAHIAFHLSGRMPQGEFDAPAGDLLPALFAGYRDLTALRYDFPLLLARAGGEGGPVQSLSALLDGAVRAAAGEGGDERLKRHAIRLEREIRRLLAEGASGPLSKLWDAAAAKIGAKDDKALKDNLGRLRAALKKADGELADCDEAMPFRLFRHVWQQLQDRKTQRFRDDIAGLIMKLSDILSSDFVRSKEGLSADRLRASMGVAQGDVFDFDAMSRLLTESAPDAPMPESRRQRVRGLLSTLRAQRFFAPGGDGDKGVDVGEPFSFAFESCAEAVAAYRERLPKMIELAKAMTMARLEAEGEYSESRHDPFFAEFGANGLDPADLASFPDYLICLRAADLGGAESELLLQAFAAGMPAKVVVRTDDLFEPSPLGDGILVSGLRARQLAGTALAAGTCYVMQASGSALHRLREPMLRGLAFAGPALFSVFSGASGAGLPPYLVAAAAAESRLFPAFTYDPSAGPDWASRFSLDGNAEVERDWPEQRLDYEDEAQQAVAETLAFTPVDFAACDPRWARHFARVPRAKWSADLVPVAAFLGREPQDVTEKVPCLLLVDRDNRLQKAVVNERLVREARRAAEAWRSLRELGGVQNSHAARLVEQERQAWEAAQAAAAPELAAAQAVTAPVAAPATPAPAAAPAPAVEEAPAERSSDEPYIETPRCTSCNECIQINDKMFGYDANKQASIVNADAGTYRQLVEAAETCQVAIIHPGKPRNPDEPGLDELVKRAEPFL